MMITVVDYKLNNLRSIENTLRRLGHEVLVTSRPEDVIAARKLILQGVGAFRDAIRNLETLGLVAPLVERVHAGIPLLGICLGMHLVFTESEEFGLHRGLSLIEGRVKRIPEGVHVPHMGWNELTLHREDPLLTGITPGSFVYFVHSYYVAPHSQGVTIASTEHGISFPAVIHEGNIWATQFHPEKSQKVGERLLANFARI
jgi:glutamine amidotransferase